jgi:dienelactone hydrolase
MSMEGLRQGICEFLGFEPPTSAVPFDTISSTDEGAYRRLRIAYRGQEGDPIPAFLLLPEQQGPLPAVLIHHQHHGQRHLGKSEVCGLEGDALQSFGPALASRGIAVLAPDSICFEDRRRNRSGTLPDEAGDVAQHYNEMCYRLLRGDTLMRKVLSDSAQGISLMRSHVRIDPERIGMLGHSYGGNTVLFHGALDDRIGFACASGAAGTFHHKISNQIGIEMAEVIPGFAMRYDIPDLVACFAPRPLLLVSATNDGASADAEQVVALAREQCAGAGVPAQIEHQRYEGGHALTQVRFDAIVSWLVNRIG